jgi:hypothetical protein
MIVANAAHLEDLHKRALLDPTRDKDKPAQRAV